MTAWATSGASVAEHDVRWKWLLLTLCVLAGVVIISTAIDEFGIGGRPWFGSWQASTSVDDHAYIGSFTQIVPGGVSANAGLRDGDRIDLREQNLDARARFATQPMASRPVTFHIHRGARAFSVTFLGATSWELGAAEKLNLLSNFLWAPWFLACATLIAARCWWRYEARVLSLVMLCQIGLFLASGLIAVPSAELQLLLTLAQAFLIYLGPILLVALSSRFGTRAGWRLPLASLAYVANAVPFLLTIPAVVGITTLWFDPLPYLSILGFLSGGSLFLAIVVYAVPPLAVVACVLAALATTPAAERPRAAWLLLPLPLALGAANVIGSLAFVVLGYSLSVGLEVISSAILLLGAFMVSYALLKRRVLDFEFVLSRTLVVATLSLIVVAAFVLLEWLLGAGLAGASHATGLIANGALALVLGLSMNYIHKRVDTFIELVFFRKRHEDERALLDFSKEAAYVTDSIALLDEAISNVEWHTDARGAALLLERNGTYAAARSFGDVPLVVGENDAAILALKTWRKPLDPHHHATALMGALALPMLTRGRLLGVLLLGEQTGGEAYAPDEVEALSQFAHGVGSAIDALSSRSDTAIELLGNRLDLIVEELRALPSKINGPSPPRSAQ